MKKLIPNAFLCAALLAMPAVAGANANSHAPRGGISPTEALSLRSLEAGDLGALRAGVTANGRSIGPIERTTLATASARATDLGALRAGDITLTDHDLKIIGIVLAVVILIIIIA